MSVASPFLSDNCQNPVGHPSFVKPEVSTMSGTQNQASTAFYLSSPVAFSPQSMFKTERVTPSSSSNSPKEDPQTHRDHMVYQEVHMGTPVAGDDVSSFTSCSVFERTPPKESSQVNVADTDRVGSVPDSSNCSIHGFPCPCGLQFADSINFIQHARHCVEFAQTAKSFAEAAAAVVCSTSSSSSSSHPSSSYTRGNTYTSPKTVSYSIERRISSSQGSESIKDAVETSDGPHDALDLTVRASDTTTVSCLGRADGDSCAELYEQLEDDTEEGEKFTCSCGSVYSSHANLLAHRVNCARSARDAVDHCGDRIHVSGAVDWIPGTHAVAAPKHLICTGCGKDGFATTADLFTHFGHCTQMIPQMTMPTSSFFVENSLKQALNPCALSTTNHPWRSSHTQEQSETPKCVESPHFPVGYMSPSVSPRIMTRNSPFSSTYFHPGLPFAFSAAHNTFQQSQTSMVTTAAIPKPVYRSPVPKGANAVESKPFMNVKESTVDLNCNTTDLSRPFKCCHCIKAFKSKALLDQHMHIHYPPKYTCRYCAKKYRWPPVFYHHQRTCKKRPPPPPTSSVSTANTTVDSSHFSSIQTSRTFGAKGIEIPVSGLFTPTSNFYPFVSYSSSKEKHSNTLNSLPMTLPINPLGSELFMNAGFQEGTHGFPSMDTVGIATFAAAAAVGLRLPFSPVPPPLGLPNPYSSVNAVPNSGLIPTSHTHRNLLPPMPVPPPPLLPPFFNPAMVPAFLPHSCYPHNPPSHSTSVSLPTSGSQTPLYASTPVFMGQSETGLPKPALPGLLCVCGISFDEVPAYLTHLANCDVLHKLVGMSPLRKVSDPVTRSTPTGIFTGTSPTFCLQDQSKPDECRLGDFKLSVKPEATVCEGHPTAKVSSVLNGPAHMVTDKEVPSTSTLSNAITTTMAAIMHYGGTHGHSLSPRVSCDRDGAVYDSGALAQGWNSVMSDSFAFTRHDIMEPHTAEAAANHRSRNAGVPRQQPRSPVCFKPESNERSQPNQSATRFSSEAAYATKAHTEASNAPSSLMNAVVTVLANAAAAAGFASGSATGDAGELPPSMEGTSSASAFGTGTAAVKLCMQCGKEFSSRLSLKQHVEGKHSAEGKYQCPGCAKRYRWGASYYYHKKSCPAIQDQHSPSEPTAQPILSGTEDESATSMLYDSPTSRVQNGEYDMLMSSMSSHMEIPFPFNSNSEGKTSPINVLSVYSTEAVDADDSGSIDCQYFAGKGTAEHTIESGLNSRPI